MVEEARQRINELDVVEFLSMQSKPVSFLAIREHTGIPQATLTRVARALCDTGYAIKVSHGRYMAGPRIMALGESVNIHLIMHRFEPILTRLAEQTGLNAELYLLASSGPVFLSSVRGASEFDLHIEPGHLIRHIDVHPTGFFYFIKYPNRHRRRDLGERWRR